MLGATGFLALCLLAATANDSKINTCHPVLTTLQAVRDVPSPFSGDKAERGDKADTESGKMSRLPKPLPIDPGYEDGKQTPRPKEDAAVDKTPPAAETAPPAKEKQTPSVTPNQVEGDVPGSVVEVESDPCGETYDPCARRFARLVQRHLDGLLARSRRHTQHVQPRNRSNGPVTFNNRSNDYQLNQFYLRMKRDVDLESEAWDLGGSVDLLYGTDSIYTTARGLEVHDDLSPKWNSPRYGAGAAAALHGNVCPWGNGLDMKLGHFYSPLGYESVAATNNFFYSHSYVFQYGEPKTFSGLLGETTLGDFTIQAGMTRGWDNWDDNNNDLGFVGRHPLEEQKRTDKSGLLHRHRPRATQPQSQRPHGLQFGHGAANQRKMALCRAARLRQRAGCRSRRNHGRLVRDQPVSLLHDQR